ncbi:MAG: DUF2752 domain-containing protein [Muribaculaceae bacterium]|nr:DUF2752 domain-containing protein [Muribaculaceae bacterium]
MILLKSNRLYWIAGVSLFLLFYFIFDPLKYGWMPQCFFHKVTGLQCMGCGSQRVVHALLHADISGAIRANALLVFSIPFLIFLLWLEFSRKSHPSLYRKVHSLPLIIVVSAILIAWLILRNILNI